MIRNTHQRTEILAAVLAMCNHPTADEVYSAVLPKCPGISRATVYRVLGNLAEEGRIRRVEMPDSPDRFDHTTCEHAHFMCEGCGKIFDFPMPEVNASPSEGFTVTSAQITFKGLCPECRGKKKD